MHDEFLYAPRALRAGADGYIMKDASGENLLRAIRQVLNGEGYVSRRMSAEFSNFLRPKFHHLQFTGGTTERREFEIFELLGRARTATRSPNNFT